MLQTSSIERVVTNTNLAGCLALLGYLSGCGGEAAVLGTGSPGAEQAADAPGKGGAANVGAAHEAWVEQANVAPGYEAKPYPSGPYGTNTGETIANLKFVGWRSPALVAYDPASSDSVELADFYDADGSKGLELLMLNAVAVWCSVCREEYKNLDETSKYKSLRPRGAEILGVLFEDNNYGPAGFSDLSGWGRRFNVEFPLVLDPGLKTGVYFDQSATPMNMVIDAKTMKILTVFTGYDEGVYTLVDSALTKRGR